MTLVKTIHSVMERQVGVNLFDIYSDIKQCPPNFIFIVLLLEKINLERRHQ